MTEPILSLSEVIYRYPDGTSALNGCTLSFQRGKRFAILGANGAGKSTMLLHLNGILRPSAGQVRWDGKPLEYHRNGLHQLRSRVGMVFQNPDSQLFSANVREDVSFGPLNQGVSLAEVRERVATALRLTRTEELADRPVHNLSFGQKKRVCIAGVLAMQPEVIVLDEPMAGLDTGMQQELTTVLDQLHQRGITIVIATHDLDFAYGWADEIAVMQRGKLLAHGRPEELFQRPEVQQELEGTPLVAEIVSRLATLGLALRSDGRLPRSRSELLQALGQHNNSNKLSS